jgi:hypothetical protein
MKKVLSPISDTRIIVHDERKPSTHPDGTPDIIAQSPLFARFKKRRKKNWITIELSNLGKFKSTIDHPISNPAVTTPASAATKQIWRPVEPHLGPTPGEDNSRRNTDRILCYTFRLVEYERSRE